MVTVANCPHSFSYNRNFGVIGYPNKDIDVGEVIKLVARRGNGEISSTINILINLFNVIILNYKVSIGIISPTLLFLSIDPISQVVAIPCPMSTSLAEGTGVGGFSIVFEASNIRVENSSLKFIEETFI